MTDASQVILVNMPFAMLQHPPLGLGLLKAALTQRGIATRIKNLHLAFGKSVGYDRYAQLAMSTPTALCGEWLWSSALWGQDVEADAAYFRDVLGVGLPPKGTPTPPMAARSGLTRQSEAETVKVLREVRAQLDPFLEACLASPQWETCRLVGFTSVFEQHLASLALAKRLKERFPHLYIVIGGANCEGRMGRATFDAFPFLDAVCSGEGDIAFPALVEQVLGRAAPGDIPGIHRGRGPSHAQKALRRSLPSVQSGSGKPAISSSSVRDMDALPIPDFDEYFEEVGEYDVEPRLVFETSRGCWWGAKQHCTFCGLNGANMSFRAKSAERALAELRQLLDRYGTHTRTVSAADNIIPLQYFKQFLPALRDLKLDVNLFYETKANLKKEQIQLYRDAGLLSIQPGIESLSTPVLRLMRKGITQLQNVQLLKWCLQFGVDPAWNYIIGFPGETPEHYAGQAELVASISHLTPPDGWGPVRFDRFSPYFDAPHEFGLRNLKPFPAYRYVYRGLPDEAHRDLAYYFDAEYDNKPDVFVYTSDVIAALNNWIEYGDRYALFSMSAGSELHIFDLRPHVTRTLHTLAGTARAVYDACDAITARSHLSAKLAAEGRRVEADEIDSALHELLAHRLLACEGESYLALGVPLGYHYAPSPAVRTRMRTVMSQGAVASEAPSLATSHVGANS